jgi:hypothetical protein
VEVRAKELEEMNKSLLEAETEERKNRERSEIFKAIESGDSTHGAS